LLAADSCPRWAYRSSNSADRARRAAGWGRRFKGEDFKRRLRHHLSVDPDAGTPGSPVAAGDAVELVKLWVAHTQALHLMFTDLQTSTVR
jgi:hypothetical protein